MEPKLPDAASIKLDRDQRTLDVVDDGEKPTAASGVMSVRNISAPFIRSPYFWIDVTGSGDSEGHYLLLRTEELRELGQKLIELADLKKS